MLWIGPGECAVAVYFIWRQVGPAALAGLGCLLLLLLPLQVRLFSACNLLLCPTRAPQLWFGHRFSVLRQAWASATDERVRLVRELVGGARIVKMFAWEPPYVQAIHQARAREMKLVRGPAGLGLGRTVLLT